MGADPLPLVPLQSSRKRQDWPSLSPYIRAWTPGARSAADWEGNERMPRILVSMMVFLAAVIASGRSAEGMSHPTMTFTEVAETAHLVVVGTAGPGTARREPGAKMIFTDFEFTDLEVLHVGKESTQVDDEATVPPEKITVSIAGGTIGNETILIPHGPSFWEGQRYILFLLDDGRPYVDPLSLIHI